MKQISNLYSVSTMARLGVYVADGFADDCEELIHRCSKKKPLTYHTFCSIWKSMNFASMYQSRTTSAELAELSEEVIMVAKHYMLADTNNFEETIASLFLVYALLNLQPFPNFAALRITPDDVPMIRYIEESVRKEKRYDALYILGAVMIKGPCQFHAAEREYGMETAFKKNFEGIDGYNANNRPKGVFMRKNEELEILEELKTLTQRYEETKAAITDEKGGIDRNLKYVETSFAEEMESSLKKVIMGLSDVDDEGKFEHQESTDRHETVQAIKKRALENAVTSMGHLTGIKERAGPSGSAIQNRSKLKKGGKIKTSSPKKPLATSPRQKKNVISRRKKTKRKKINSSESEGDDLELPDSDGDDISQANSDGESQADIDITRFVKDSQEKQHNNDLNEIDTAEDDEAIARLEKEINIEIDTLPVLIRKSNNQNIEIEFIDNYKKECNPSTSKVKGEVKKDLKSKIAELDDVSIVKNTPQSETPEMDFIFKRPGRGRCYTSKAKFKLLSNKGSEQVKSTLKTMGFKEMPNIDDAKKA